MGEGNADCKPGGNPSRSAPKTVAPNPASRPTRGASWPARATVAQLAEFDEIIDVRSESEFADDHVPGAVNCPVLNDCERAEVGTLYKQRSSFDAKKTGAALVSINIARHLQERFHDRPRAWRPLVYCWRGGGRSAALAHVFAQIGWRVGQLDGGYRAYRRAVIDDLAALPGRFTWRVLCGMTGTGKSLLLREIAAAGGQVLDLEHLAMHRGSVLGDVPDHSQPTQKRFESAIWQALQAADARRPVYVESESRKIGSLRVPEALVESMWAAECIVVEAPVAVRVALLKAEYGHFLDRPESLVRQLECLIPLHGRETVARWAGLARARAWDALTEELLVRHYDPAYARAITRHYPSLPRAPRLLLQEPGAHAIAALARACRAAEQPVAPAA